MSELGHESIDVVLVAFGMKRECVALQHVRASSPFHSVIEHHVALIREQDEDVRSIGLNLDHDCGKRPLYQPSRPL